jgi:uncharacterized protein (TIGR00297 family)
MAGSEHWFSWAQWGNALLAALIFTALGRWLRGVSNSGAVAGAALCFLLGACAGGGALAALVSVFVLTWCATRFGESRKQKSGVAEKSGGRRASQVLANLGVATAAAGLYRIHANLALVLAMAAALSEAAADTVASEIGQAAGSNPRLITTWRVVPPGTDGGVTPAGTVAGAIAAAAVSAICAATGLIPWNWFAISLAAAMAGMLADSFLGAWLEQRSILNNDLVNFFGTLTAAVLVMLAALTSR